LKKRDWGHFKCAGRRHAVQGGLDWPRRRWCRLTICVDSELAVWLFQH